MHTQTLKYAQDWVEEFASSMHNKRTQSGAAMPALGTNMRAGGPEHARWCTGKNDPWFPTPARATSPISPTDKRLSCTWSTARVSWAHVRRIINQDRPSFVPGPRNNPVALSCRRLVVFPGRAGRRFPQRFWRWSRSGIISQRKGLSGPTITMRGAIYVANADAVGAFLRHANRPQHAARNLPKAIHSRRRLGMSHQGRIDGTRTKRFSTPQRNATTTRNDTPNNVATRSGSECTFPCRSRRICRERRAGTESRAPISREHALTKVTPTSTRTFTRRSCDDEPTFVIVYKSISPTRKRGKQAPAMALRTIAGGHVMLSESITACEQQA